MLVFMKSIILCCFIINSKLEQTQFFVSPWRRFRVPTAHLRPDHPVPRRQSCHTEDRTRSRSSRRQSTCTPRIRWCRRNRWCCQWDRVRIRCQSRNLNWWTWCLFRLQSEIDARERKDSRWWWYRINFIQQGIISLEGN